MNTIFFHGNHEKNERTAPEILKMNLVSIKSYSICFTAYNYKTV